jgi:nitrate/nitrite-specific signal transduction histidine kinase
LLPVALLVIVFAIAGQFGYTQVTESLAGSRSVETAKLEAARVGDYLLDSVRALQQLADSPVLLTKESNSIFLTIRSEPLIEAFDYVQVADATGHVLAASDATRGGSVLHKQSFEFLRTPGLPMTMAPGQLKDGRDAIVISVVYKDTQAAFAGVVEGAIALGSPKLGVPLRDSGVYGSALTSSAGGFSYLVGGDARVLWHPEEAKVGTQAALDTRTEAARTTAGASITTTDGVRYIVAHAPLNLGQLLPRTKVDPLWIEWFVVTQHRWSDVVGPVTSLLYWLVALAVVMLLLSVALVARSAQRLTIPVAKLVNAAHELSAGKLRHKLGTIEISGPVEIEQLARQFNSMAEELHTAYADLEQKVSDRTKELAAANAELKRRLRESQTMQVVASKFAGKAGLEEILEAIAYSATEALEAEGSVVFLPSEQQPEYLEAAVVNNMPGIAAGNLVAIDKSLTGLTFRTGEPQRSQEVSQDPRADRSYVERTGSKSVLSVPLISTGQVIGVINTINKRLGTFNEEDVRLLTLLANQAAVAVERAKLFTEARKQVETLKTVNELSLSITASRSIEETLVGGMEHIGKLLGASGAVVFLINEKARQLEYTASYNIGPAHLALIRNEVLAVDRRQEKTYAALEAFLNQQPFQVNNMTDKEYVRQWEEQIARNATKFNAGDPDEFGVMSLVALPLTVHNKRLGSMTLYFSDARTFMERDVKLFQSFANILGLAVYNTQLVAQAGKLATVEERARLARELHDSVTQSLFSLNLTLRAARRKMTIKPEQADALLDSVQELAQGALAEMRALIFELRPQALANEGLVLALEKHADSIRARSGLRVRLDIEGDRRLPLETEEALYQIAREALHNVVKHASAREAWISLNLTGDRVSLAIKDDGKGFDLEKMMDGGGSHIGTSTMRERAEAIGATLKLESRPGGGTEVLVSATLDGHGPGESIAQEALSEARAAPTS